MSTKPETNAVTVAQPAAAVAMPVWMTGIAGALPEAVAAGKIILESGFCPPAYKSPQAVIVACAMGARLGLDPFSALAGIAVVNNRPTLYGDAMLAVCQAHPAFEDIQEKIEGTGDAMAAVVTIKRKNRSPYTATFSVGDAKVAGLWGKSGPWTQNPKRMMTMRARAFALRGAFADALAGFHSREEMEDVEPIDVTSTATVHPATPEPARTAIPAPGDDVAALSGKAPAAAPAPAAQAQAQQQPAPAPLKHPAFTAATNMMTALNAIRPDFGKAVLVRICKLHKADAPKGLAAKVLDAFGKDVEAIASITGDTPEARIASIEDTLGTWEQAHNEGAQEKLF